MNMKTIANNRDWRFFYDLMQCIEW